MKQPNLNTMKKLSHTVRIHIYNPQNLKEEIGTRVFHIEYVPTEDWYRYHILVDGFYRGYDINIDSIRQCRQSPRKLVAKSLSNCLQDIKIEYNKKEEIVFPNWNWVKLGTRLFNEQLLYMGDFVNRDELTKYGIILNKKKKLLINETT